MKAVRKLRPEPGADFVDVDIPQPGCSEVLVKVKAAALCKSDIDVVEWTDLVQRGNYPLPFTLGHEFAGEVVEVGPDVRGVAVGDRVAGETHRPCGICHACHTGNQHICRNGMGVLGRSMDGCFAEYIKLPDFMAVHLSDSVDYVQGAVMEPLATALHTLTKAQPWGDSVAVLGVGTIGQMAVALARHLGASKIFALGRSPLKLEAARAMGADVVIDGASEDFVEVVLRETNCAGVGSVIDMTGNEKVINQAVEALRVAGRLVFCGMVEKPLTFENFMYGAVYKELQLTGIFGRRMFDTWEMLHSILATGKIDVDAFVGKEIPFAAFHEGVKEFSQVNGRIVLRVDD